MTNKIHDYIVVGSGPSAAMAAQTLIESGRKVLMLDAGNRDEKYADLVPDENFCTIRRNHADQHRYFLGDKFEAIPFKSVKTGAQLSPSRKLMIKDVNRLSPVISDSFNPMESMGYGGLGAGWGLGAYVYSRPELKKCGLAPSEMKAAYQTVSDRIGISVGNEEIRYFIAGGLQNTQPPLKMEPAIENMRKRFEKNEDYFTKQNCYFGHPSMALLTKDLNERKATQYNDMDFYADKGKSAWRAWMTIDELQKSPDFTYMGGYLALRFTEEKDEYSSLHCLKMADNTQIELKARKIILAASPLGTARICLRSFKSRKQLPLLCNPYTYMPCINLKALGHLPPQHKSSMAQAMMIYDPDDKDENLVSLAFYTFRSLLLFRIIKEAPLNFRHARPLMQYLQSAFVIAGIHHPDTIDGEKTMELIPHENPVGDALKIDFEWGEYDQKMLKKHERKVRKFLRKLGVFPIKRLDPGAGSSIHYAGTVPFSYWEKEGHQDHDGKLHTFNRIYCADASGFNYLPAKGITLTLMANAHRVAQKIINYEEGNIY